MRQLLFCVGLSFPLFAMNKNSLEKGKEKHATILADAICTGDIEKVRDFFQRPFTIAFKGYMPWSIQCPKPDFEAFVISEEHVLSYATKQGKHEVVNFLLNYKKPSRYHVQQCLQESMCGDFYCNNLEAVIIACAQLIAYGANVEPLKKI